MPNNRILFIVEGLNDEVQFVRRLLTKCCAPQEFEIYPYKCNIHVLSQILYNEYPNFEEDEVDIQLVLRSKEADQHKQKILNQKYRDIFLIFDYEPQHDLPHFGTVRRMLNYFDDSSNQGKLYINYPMMQSYKHFSKLPDDSFWSKAVSKEMCLHYKEIVGKESIFTDISKYSYSTFMSLAVHHIKKANYLLSGVYEIPMADKFIEWNMTDIYDIQTASLNDYGKIFVLNTCIFILADFAPNDFFKTVSKKQLLFDI